MEIKPSQEWQEDTLQKLSSIGSVTPKKNPKTKGINFWPGAYALLATMFIVVGVVSFYISTYKSSGTTGGDLYAEKVDDWVYQGIEVDAELDRAKSYNYSESPVFDSVSSISGDISQELGYSVGGAKDVSNFRNNVEEGYLPLPTDITHEGLFYDYYFDTGEKGECEDLFCPSYSTAVSESPFTAEEEYFMTVGLNSNVAVDDFSRKKLNLVLVLDISGSMDSGFTEYYYDRDSSRAPEDNSSKLDIAKKSMSGLIDQLEPDDRFGVVLFGSNAALAKPVRLVGETDIPKIKEHMSRIVADGGTNMEAGYKTAEEALAEFEGADRSEYENRIIFITDAMPNTGYVGSDQLVGLTNAAAEKGIYTSFIGIGVDFNTELVNQISDVKGANYYSVHSAEDFEKRLVEEFEYMVTPMVFDLKLEFESEDFEIAEVYGVPGVDKSLGEVMNVKTLFPSATDDGETKGGLILLKLNKLTDKPASESEIALNVSYKDREGDAFDSEREVSFEDIEGEYYQNSGIRKGILLTRYANLMQSWVIDQAAFDEGEKYYLGTDLLIYDEGRISSIESEEEYLRILGHWERTSTNLEVSEEYREILADFREYFEKEAGEISDDELDQEILLIDKVLQE